MQTNLSLLLLLLLHLLLHLLHLGLLLLLLGALRIAGKASLGAERRLVLVPVLAVLLLSGDLRGFGAQWRSRRGSDLDGHLDSVGDGCEGGVLVG